ncbi:MAG: NADH-quinone oxidoreductase subunit C [Gammaproteobacteria bacterium]|nr:MAG: NADH-quinone oxidoreductase subunit C [Gammaproteobacteria bacterium]
MARSLKQLGAKLEEKLASSLKNSIFAVGELTIEINAADVLSVCQSLRDDFGFSQMIDLCGVDFSQYGQDEWQTASATSTGFSRGIQEQSHGRGAQAAKAVVLSTHPSRYAVVYHLMSINENQRLRVRAWCSDDDFPVINSVLDIWPSANWFEREAYDLFGIHFEGHPDLRRILTDYGFVGHPFRKDFPLSGQVEMRYDAEKGRVVYEPVSIEPRVLVPRVIRKEEGESVSA